MQNLLFVFGGQSPEHEVSVISARNIYKAIDRKLFNPILCAVSKSGCFYEFDENKLENCKEVLDDDENLKKVANFVRFPDRTEFKAQNKSIKIDIVFSIIHGQYGEDGAIPGFFQIYNLPVVGCDLASSAICMDKTLAKMIAENNDIKTPSFVAFYKENIKSFEECKNLFGLPFFFKIANLGSSVGVYKIKSEADYDDALKKVWQFGDKVIVEKAIENLQEIEIAILEENGKIAVSDVLGEIKHNASKYDFYDYEAKYIDPDGAELIVPARVNKEITDEIKESAIKIFKACGCKGMARVDFLVNETGVYFNEINTLPGFTNISMYPMLLQKSGLSYSELITRLIFSALK